MASGGLTFPSANYARLCRLLIDMGPLALRYAFDKIHHPTSLHDDLIRPPVHTILQSLKQERALSGAQWRKLYPLIPSSVSSASFDLPLLILLLKYICGLSQPSTGWGSLPPTDDAGIAANISRVIYYRDRVYELHACQAFVDDATCNIFWNDISNALVGLEIGPVYCDAISRLKTESMDPEFLEDYQKSVKEWKRDDDRIKDKRDKMKRIVKVKRRNIEENNEDKEMEGTRLQMKHKKTKEKSNGDFAEIDGKKTKQVEKRCSMPCSNSPPRLRKQLPKISDLPNISRPWSDVDLPIDVLLLTVEDVEFLGCLSYLVEPFKCYRCEIGCVFFGTVDGGHEEKQKIALMKCPKGPEGSLIMVKNAVGVLGPKAVFSVGVCSGTSSQNTKLGDVVVASKLTTFEGMKIPVSSRIGNIIRHVADGWVAPLENPDEWEVKVHYDGDVLSAPLADSYGLLHEDIIQQHPEVIAVEKEGGALHAAAYDCKVEWMMVKGVACHETVSELSNHEWVSFASIMAASVAANILADPFILKGWPHYSPANIPIRLDWETIARPGAQGNERIPSRDEIYRFIAFHSFPAFDVSRPEGRNGFVRYLEEVRKVLVVGSHEGSLIVTVQCSSLQILKELWEDYKTGHLNEMAQTYLVTEDLLKAFGLIEVKLTTTIEGNEYRACKNFFSQQLGMAEIKHGEVEEGKEDDFREMEGTHKILRKEVQEESEGKRRRVEEWLKLNMVKLMKRKRMTLEKWKEWLKLNMEKLKKRKRMTLEKWKLCYQGMQKILCKEDQEESEGKRGGIEDSSSRDLSLPSGMDPQQQNNGFGQLSKPRGNYATVTAAVLIIISAVIFIGPMVAHASREDERKDKIYSLIFGTALLILSFAFGELVRRMCLLIEELQHLQTRYDGRLKILLTSIFTLSYGHSIFIVCIVSLLIVCCGLYENYNTYYRPDYAILLFLNSFFVPLLLFIVGFREPSILDVSQINERENQNVADGLAWSYYFGYLRLVLPRLDEQIAKSSSEFRFRITKKKLFILVPKTCLTHGIIEEDDSRVKCAGNLLPMEINRGGILKRSYKQTVYRIQMPRPDDSGEVDEYLVIMEYAAPLMTLYDMSQHPKAKMSRQQRDEQVMLFTRKLKEILDGCPDCRGKYELVPLSGERNQIASVIVQMHHDARLMLDES